MAAKDWGLTGLTFELLGKKLVIHHSNSEHHPFEVYIYIYVYDILYFYSYTTRYYKVMFIVLIGRFAFFLFLGG